MSCAVSLSVSFFPVYPAEWCVLNGKVTLVLIVCPLLYELFVITMVINNVNT